MLTLPEKTHPPWVIAHRGFSSDYPENTFAAFDAALAVPVHAIELDIQMSLDRVSLIYHDRTLYKAGGGLKNVQSQSWQYLAKLDASRHFQSFMPPQRLPMLEEVLNLYGHRCVLLLEIKGYESDRVRSLYLMDQVIEKIQHHRLRERVCILCYDLELLAYAYYRDNGLRYIWNLDRSYFDHSASFLYAYSVNIRGILEDITRTTQKEGKPVFTFTCDTKTQLKHAMQCGVDGIMSNNPRWLARSLEAYFCREEV